MPTASIEEVYGGRLNLLIELVEVERGTAATRPTPLDPDLLAELRDR